MENREIIYLQRNEFDSKIGPLRLVCREVTDFGDSFQRDLFELTRCFESHKIAVGLSAPQIGIDARVCVLNLSKEKQPPHLVLVNPIIIESSVETKDGYESCMSLPFYKGKVLRHTKIKVSFQDTSGCKQSMDFSGFGARVVQHEIDHINGILYVDHLRSLDLLEPTDLFDNDDLYRNAPRS